MPAAARTEHDFDPLTTAGRQPRYRAARAAYTAGRKGRGFSVDMLDVPDMAALRELYEQGQADRELDRQQLAGVRGGEPVTVPLPATSSSSAPAPSSSPPVPPPSSSSSPTSSPTPHPRARARPRPAARGGGGPQIINDGAGFVLGLVGFALFLNFLRGGNAQARGWLAAKFLNRPFGVAPSPPAQPAAPDRPASAPASSSSPSGGKGGLGGIAAGAVGNAIGAPKVRTA